MSQFGLNSIPIVDNNAMGGFRAGLDTMRGIRHSNSNLASEDLLRQKTEQDMETVQLKRPLDAIEQAYKIAEAERLKAEMDSGQWDQDRQRKRDMEQANLTAKLDENQLKRLEKRIAGVQAVGQIFGEDANEATMAMSWETAREHGKEYGFDIGEYSQANAAKVLRMRQATPQAMRLYENQVKERQQLDRTLIEKGAEANYRSAEAQRHEAWQGGENKLNRQAQRDVASIYRSDSGGGGDPNTWSGQKAEAISALQRFEKGGPPPSEAQLLLLENEFVTKPLAAALQRNTAYILAKAKQSNPATKAEGEREAAAIEDAARVSLPAANYIDKARAAKSGGSVTAAPAKTKELTPEQKALRAKHGL